LELEGFGQWGAVVLQTSELYEPAINQNVEDEAGKGEQAGEQKGHPVVVVVKIEKESHGRRH
jgi:hypothetical protein